ncbi:2,3-dihydro-2,3-dihydroxybenzoate dehydrogenase [Thermoactinomyces sp. DSM 45892]|uniref:2,3-dihydro-2,3-dihydroxybenzoate dehydrogenase n=1 Tax=Thermoactinomyces sp. DSM 45892 TaxID=1882753 RepID=UPI0008976291|nr:2,3-dihydro-2,3-dihydroxybenzoate dehydrogenase [Thermoactinomyces sp. DSM 45892]SDZ09940.1 2,3-dihydro-2,3-dihydroxybenzoate dehydrogenase [Thermoactinomyces sp. DSM 45892]
MEELNRRVAIVTGAAGGIGRTVARELAKSGMFVAAFDCDEQGIYQLESELKEDGSDGAVFQVDIRNRTKVESVIDQIEAGIGPIEVLVNVAGVLRMGNVNNLTDEDWEQTFAVNSTGVFYLSRSVSRRMISRRRGSIVTVGSNAASTPRMSFSAYASSKAAAVMFTKCLGLELAQYNIRCNIVSPGSTETDMLKLLWEDDERSKDRCINGVSEDYRLGIPLRKIARPIDIAETVLFLVSDRSSHITMQNICIDGGATLGV